jgi:hypothetical protein
MADDVADPVAVVELIVEVLVFLLEGAAGEGAGDDQGDFFRLTAWSGSHTALAHALHRGLHGAVGGEDDDGDGMVDLLDLVHQLRPRDPDHLQVGDDQIDFVVFDDGERLLPAGGKEYIIPSAMNASPRPVRIFFSSSTINKRAGIHTSTGNEGNTQTAAAMESAFSTSSSFCLRPDSSESRANHSRYSVRSSSSALS